MIAAPTEHQQRGRVAQRNLFNRMIGILHHCLTTRTLYDEHLAFPVPGQTESAYSTRRRVTS